MIIPIKTAITSLTPTIKISIIQTTHQASKMIIINLRVLIIHYKTVTIWRPKIIPKATP